MPKMKTHKGYKKVVNQKPSGTIQIGCAGTRHNTGKKNAASNRTGRKGAKLSTGDFRRIKNMI